MTPADPPATDTTTTTPPARALPRALREFLNTETAGGAFLLVGALAALVWANSPWQDSYGSLWATDVELRVGTLGFDDDLQHLVNDALMAVFFFVVGLEIKRELVAGELQSWRSAALPVFAALGGMVVPAALYAVLNAGEVGGRGWGIPMATDIAFALGVVALLGARVPSSLKLFLLTLAIVDDIGAIVVIAVFYSDDIAIDALVVAGALLGVMALLRWQRIRWRPIFFLIGGLVWLAVYESGVHATIAGVVLGLLAPFRETARLQHELHPVTSFAIVPLFALANAGVALEADALTESGPRLVAIGVAVGLVAGKLAGVTGASWLAVRLRVGRLPDGATWAQLVGIAALAGIGFTVSLFITGLAFDDGDLVAGAKLGILAASLAAAVLGAGLLARACRRLT